MAYLPEVVFALLSYGFVSLIFGSAAVTEHAASAVLAGVFGALVGASELASRYRDEPLRAIRKPWGVLYQEINALLSVLGLLLIYRYPDKFAGVANDSMLAAVAAGFGAMVVMRTRLAVVKGSSGEDYSIGPDIVLSVLLKLVDANVDRDRALDRQRLVARRLNDIRSLGDFNQAYDYLAASLFAFQNLDENLRRKLTDIFTQYKQEPNLSADIKYLALGFFFLTTVGEKHFDAVLDAAKRIKATTPAPLTLSAAPIASVTTSAAAAPPPAPSAPPPPPP